MSRGIIGVLLMSFGGPDSLDAVAPFMTNLLGRKPPPPMVKAVQARYEAIGGFSPLPVIASRLAGKLESHLTSQTGIPHAVRVGMCHWHPFIADALRDLAAMGADRIIAVSLSSHETRVTTGAYRNAVEAAREAAREESSLPPVTYAAPWFDHPDFIESLAEELAAVLEGIPEDEKDGLEVVFTAHSLPAVYVRDGDPYIDQLEVTASALARRAGLRSRRLAFQSRSAGGGEWLKPAIEDVLEEYAAAGRTRILVDPIGFAIDHMETLYDLDILLRREAEARGITLHRCRCPNDSPGMVETMAAVVGAALAEDPS